MVLNEISSLDDEQQKESIEIPNRESTKEQKESMVHNTMTDEEKDALRKSVESSLKQNKFVYQMLHDI